MINITRFYLLPSTITTQEKLDYDLAICKLTGIKDQNGNSVDGVTLKHSEFVEHPTNGTFIYAVNGFYENKLTEQQKTECKPSLNFADATDDKLYSKQEVIDIGFFKDPGF